MQRTLVTTLATLAGVALAVPAAAADQPSTTPAKRSWGAESSPLMRPGSAVRYWTAGKQAKAKAANLPKSGSESRSVRLSQSGPARLPGSRAAHAQPRSVPAAKRLTPGGDVNGYVRVPRPYTSADFSRISGRLFFVNAGGNGDSCSASVVRSEARLLIVTAAHCVYSVPDGATSGRWHSSFAFVPAYDGRAGDVREREPYGRWGGRRAWKPDGYTGLSGGDWNSVYDIALIEVGRHRDGTLQGAVGAFTPMRNQGGKYSIATTGYPGILGRKPYDGRDQLWCLGKTQQIRSFNTDGIETGSLLNARAAASGTATGTGRMETRNCHLFQGHSGGPWVVRGTGDLVGVLSAGKEDGEADGNSVANALSPESYGAIVQRADPRGVYDSLSVRLTGPALPVRRGGTAPVTATVTMRGLMAAAQVPVTLSVPAGASLASVSGAACTRTSRHATCTIGAVHPGRPVRITARIDVARDAGPSVPVTAHVTSTRLDPAQRDNTSVTRIRTFR
ncbi:trypsin-like peptidase domain-containing protein [Nonomuraea zeae]|uniref:Trypsin-like serine protease n=1 Tax=Nonomuraea zeae TaxID=1642303 RepID=A0A5S4EZ64_9ACTN|nr:trypsin-like peptidase domain-containing protein [Nonomuraea zeae]TMR08879.1 trypsin-like serine protease [Nonomuraea zeae]